MRGNVFMRKLVCTILVFFLNVTGILAGEPAPIAPDPRSKSEVDAVLKNAPPPVAEDKLRALNILLLAGKKDHGPGEHDYPLWQKNWTPLVKKLPKVTVDA